MQDRQQSDGFKYWAFISYSHDDLKWGKWLHRCLDTYRVPKKLVGQNSADGPRPRRLFPIFLDREELAASPNLPGPILEALQQSRYLIVICSPRAARSKWVNEEIKAFKKLGRQDRVLALIVDGEPNASDGITGVSIEQECFPEAMRYSFAPDGISSSETVDPGAPDVRPGKGGRANAGLRLLAGILSVGFDTLKQRERQRSIRRLIWISIGTIIIAVTLAILGEEAKNATELKQRALTDNFFRTIGVSNEKTPTRDEQEALWELAQLDRANGAVRGDLLNRWFATADAFIRGNARDGQGFRSATGLNIQYHRLATSDAAELGRRLAAVLEQETNPGRLSRLSDALAALANKMEPQAAAEIAEGLAAALENPQETDSDRFSNLGYALAPLANKTEPHAAAEIARRAAQRLAAALENPQETNPTRLPRLGYALTTLAIKIEPQAAVEIAKGLADALENSQETNFERLSRLGSALAALAAKIEPQAAVEIAKGLAAALENPQETDSHRLSSLGDALAALANKMEPQAAAEIARRAAQRLAAALDSGQGLNIRDALAALANKMEPQAAAEIAKGLATALENPHGVSGGSHPNPEGETISAQAEQVLRLGDALAALANKMEPQAAAEIARRVAQLLAVALENPHETDSGTQLWSLGNALAALVNKMEPQAAVEIARRDAQPLAAALENRQTTDAYLLWRLGDTLAKLANKMEPQAAAEIAEGLSAALENPQETDSHRLLSLGNALAALADKMEPQAAAEIARRGAQRLAAALDSGQDLYISEALAALVNKMEPQAAAEIARRGAQRLATALENPQEWKDPLSCRMFSLAQGNTLAALANKMDPQAAAEIARRGAQRLAAALQNPQKTDSDWVLCLGYALAEFCRLLPSARHTHLLALSNMLLLPYDWKLLKEVCAQLRTEDLAEILKYPFCTGEAEDVALEQLKAKTQRDFGGDAWKFVEQANSLGIKNVDNPPTRPSATDALKELEAL